MNETKFEYLIYPFNDDIRDLFFEERQITNYVVSRDDKKTAPANLSLDLRNLLGKSGFTVTPIKKNYLCGIKELCENNIDVNKMVDENKNVKAVLIRVHGFDEEDLDRKTKTIQTFIKSKFGIESEKILFSKTDRC